jgi:hypothetical protein
MFAKKSSGGRRISFAGRRQIFWQLPRIAVLLEPMHYVIGDAIPFLFV